MIIEKEDFKDIHAVVKEHLSYETTTSYSFPEIWLKGMVYTSVPDGKILVCFIIFTLMIAIGMISIRVDSLAKVMDKVENGELQPKIITETIQGKELIDLGLMVKEMELVEGLHQKMKGADWYYEYSDDSRVWSRGSTEVKDIKNDLQKLSKSPEGIASANKLWQLYVPQHSVHKPDFLEPKKLNIMDEKVSGFNEGQFKRLGMGEAYTPELKKQMDDQVPLINHSFSKEYDGDKVNVEVHLKKSSTSELYFINKYDLSLQKADSKKIIQQTFYVGNTKKGEQGQGDGQKETPDQYYTLKKAYHFLAGRPVYMKAVSPGIRSIYQRSMKAVTMATQRFDKNYGFDLGNVLSKYSLANEKYKSSLIESLQRGNLQKEKFEDKDGKVEEFYVSPSIRTGSLTLYDQNKKVVPIETQMEKQLIDKKLGEELKELFQKKQSSEQSQKQEPKQTQPGEANKNSQKQAPARKERKHTSKQKAGK